MHLWHGFVVTPGPMVATNLEYNTRDKEIYFGFGVELERLQMLQIKQDKVSAADYKIFQSIQYIVSQINFFIEAVTHNNYTGVEERGDVLHYWSYDKKTRI
jgi:hypothetical protein